MSYFDNEKGQHIPEHSAQPESFENTSHAILRNPPILIDLDQPDRVDEDLLEEFFEDNIEIDNAKCIAEIETPATINMGLFLVKEPDFDPFVLVVKGVDSFVSIGRGETQDLSDTEGAGNCLVTVDNNGNVFVYADKVDYRYRISTRELAVHPASEEPSVEGDLDDPEL